MNDTARSHSDLSGPDFLHAHTFFPNASTYVLAAVEPVGPLPDVTKLSTGELSASLWNLRNSLNASLSFSFFITADMKKDLQATKLTGTLPVLYVFLARCGCTIQSVENVWLDASVFIVIGMASTIIALIRAIVRIRNTTPEMNTAPKATRQS